METIKSYLDTMFGALPKTDEVLRVKQELLSTMEDKYNDLKAEGKSENEAVGQVISEFGNIDEITSELGIEIAQKSENAEEENVKFVADDEAREFITAHKKGGVVIGIGVMLCILAPAALILIASLTEYTLFGYSVNETVAGVGSVAALFVLIAIAVALFIIQGIKLERYEDYEKTAIALSDNMRVQLTEENKAYTTKFALSIAGGVALIFAGVISMIVLGSYEFTSIAAVPVLLAFISIGVYLFVSSGMRRGSYEILLETGDHKREKKQGKSTKAGRIVNAVNSIMWPLVVAGYLIWSFSSGSWGISWIVFPIAGLLSAAIEGVANAISGEDE